MFDSKFDYNRAEYEKVSCNLCGQDKGEPIGHKDRYGLAVRTVICRNCGLIFISPRMSLADYGSFYMFEYRALVKKYRSQIKKRKYSPPAGLDLDKMFISSTKFGSEIVERLGSYFSGNQGLTIEVGSSCGGILNALRLARPGLDVLGIEPSPVEANYALSRDINTRVSMFESFDSSVLRLPPVQNILTVRSLNHLLDPSEFINWSYRQLAVGGKLMIVVVDFVEFCRRRGHLRTQIDHPYMFTNQTLSSLVKKAGFKLEYCTTEKDFIYLVAKKESMVQPQQFVADQAIYRKNKQSLKYWNLLGHYWLRKIKAKFVYNLYENSFFIC